MLSSAIIPLWFVGYNIALEFLFALVSFAVSHYAFKAHRISMQRPARLFGFGFLFIGIAYVVQPLLNLGIVEVFGKIHFLFALDHGTYYVVGHVLELAAYLLILANLILVLRHDKKA